MEEPMQASSRQSSVALERDSVVALPCGAPGWSDLVCSVTLDTQATMVLARAGQAAQLSVLVHRVHNPVHARVLHTRPGFR